MKIETKYTKHIYSSYKKHHHDILSIAIIKQGEIQIEYDHTNERLRPKSLAVFNPFENHKTTLVHTNTSDYYVIYFHLDKSETFHVITPSIIRDDSLYHNFLALHESKNSEDGILYLNQIFKSYTDETPSTKKKQGELLDKALKFIETNDYDEITLETLARHIEISQNHLIRLFKKEFGLSAHAYILNQKIHKAKLLLEQGMPIAQVASAVGFYDQSHFHKAFKSVFALTPKEFQKR